MSAEQREETGAARTDVEESLRKADRIDPDVRTPRSRVPGAHGRGHESPACNGRLDDADVRDRGVRDDVGDGTVRDDVRDRRYAMTSEMAPYATTFGIVRYAMSKPVRRGSMSTTARPGTTFAVATTGETAGSSTKGPPIPAADPRPVS